MAQPRHSDPTEVSQLGAAAEAAPEAGSTAEGPLASAPSGRWQRALRRRKQILTAQPAAHLRADPRRPHHYSCEESPASLALRPASGSFGHGWMRLRLHCACCPQADLQLHLRLETGDAPPQSTALGLAPDGHLCAIVYFPPGLQAVFLEVSSHNGCTFALRHMTLRQITKQEALLSLSMQAVVQRRPTPRRLWSLGRATARLVRQGGVVTAVERLRATLQRTPGAYQAWIRRHETPSPAAARAMRQHMAQFVAPPCISILMPVYNAPAEYLLRAIDSVRAQSYPHWQLCIANDCSTEPYVASILASAAAADPRIVTVNRSRNGHISAASNSALKLCSGEFVALLDHDDELSPQALYFVACEILAHPQAGLIYSDEDKLDAAGERCDPYFKPDYDLDLLRGQNFISHLGVYRRSLMLKVGGFRLGFEGSQDHDLALRICELLQPAQVRHIPRVLYHWRAVAGSTAQAGSAKPYAHLAAQRALTEHLQRQAPGAQLGRSPGTGLHRVRYPLPDKLPQVALIVPTRDRVDLLQRMLESLREHTAYSPYRLVVVDNQSREPATKRYLQQLQRTHTAEVLPYDAPFNFAAICNAAAAHVRDTLPAAPILGFLNNDLEITEDSWLEEMVRQVLRPEVGAVGAKLLFANGTVQHAGVVCGLGGIASHAHKHAAHNSPGHFGRLSLAAQYTAVTAACLLVRQAAFWQVDGFDETLQVAYNDVDLCLRLRAAGYKNMFTPHAVLLHHESASRGSDSSPQKMRRFAQESALMQQRWGAVIANDPYYNPNLSLRTEDFALAETPRLTVPWEAFLEAPAQVNQTEGTGLIVS
jgi:glycosyltransferase involved in cell wall biosynthesis